VLIAVRMAPIETLMHLWRNDKTEFWLMVFVCVVSVFLDPTYGLVLGMVLAFIINADNVAQFHTELRLIDNAEQVQGESCLPLLTVMPADMRSSCVGAVCGQSNGAPQEPTVPGVVSRPEEVHIDMQAPSTPKISPPVRGRPTVDEAGVVWQERTQGDPVACYEPRGALTYVNADAIEAQMKRLQNLPAVLVNLDKVYFMDIDGVDRVGKMVQRWRDQQMLVVVCGTDGEGKGILSRAAWLSDMREAGLVAPNTAAGYQVLLDLTMAEGGTPDDGVESSPLLTPATASSKKKLAGLAEPVPFHSSPVLAPATTQPVSVEDDSANATTETA
jgi:MFS superfamily sulfate permease-like transporter